MQHCMSDEGASTTRLVRLADMSKGMLYYYFKNKKSFFKVCMEYTLERVNNIGLDETGIY